MPDDQNRDNNLGPALQQTQAQPLPPAGPGKPGSGTDQSGAKKAWQGGWQINPPAQLPKAKAATQAPPPPADIAPHLEVLLLTQKHKLRRFFMRTGIFVLLPCFVVWFYTALIATPRYVCTYQITYQTYEATSSLSGGLTPSVIGSSLANSIDYGALLYQYIRSAQLAEDVDAKLHLRKYYASHHIDWLSRLDRHANQANFLAYWQSHVSVSEGFGGYITIAVQGFDPQFSLKLAQAIYDDTDEMMSRLTAKASANMVATATNQLAQASVGLQKSNDALTTFRNTHGDLDPSLIATQLAGVEGALESQIAAANAQLAQDEANMQPNASQIVQMKLQISGLQSQLNAERQRLASSNGQSNYSDMVTQYETMITNQLLATSVYQAAQQGLIIAQADATQKQNYVVDYIPPLLPDRPTVPDPLQDTLITFLACLCIYGIANLLVSAFRDQAGI